MHSFGYPGAPARGHGRQEWKSPNNPRSVPGLRQLCQVCPHRQIVTWLTAKSSPGVVQELGTPMVPLTDLDGLDGGFFRRILEAKDSKASHGWGWNRWWTPISEDHIVLGRIRTSEKHVFFWDVFGGRRASKSQRWQTNGCQFWRIDWNPSEAKKHTGPWRLKVVRTEWQAGHEKCRAFFSTDDVSIFQIPKNQAISSNAAVLFMILMFVF